MDVRLLHPWALTELERAYSVYDVARIQQYIKDKEFTSLATAPDVSVITVLEAVMTEFADMLESNTVPFLHVVTQSPDVVNTCANLLPASLHCSTMRTVISTTVDAMLRNFVTSNSVIVRGEEMDLDYKDIYKNIDFLIISGINEKTAYASKQSNRFYDVFQDRFNNKLPTLIISICQRSVTEDVVVSIYDDIRNFIGEGVSHLFYSACRVLPVIKEIPDPVIKQGVLV